jgi:uncharacterized membrane protein
MDWFYLALLAPFLTAIVNLFDDNLLRHVYKSAHAGVIISGLFGLVPALIILLAGANDDYLSPGLIGLSLLSGFLAVIAIFYYFKGLESDNPSVVAALFSLTPAIMPFLAHFIVGERLSTRAIIGFVIVITSGFLYSLSDIKKFKFSKALVPILIASVMFDASSLAGKYSYDRAGFYSAYLYVSLGMALGGLFYAVAWRAVGNKLSAKSLRKQGLVKLFPLLALVEGIGLAALFSYNKALSLGPVSLVNALDTAQPLFVLLLAISLYPFYPKYFREAEAGRITVKILLALLMIAGIYITVG